jgi:hypothetical protein
MSRDMPAPSTAEVQRLFKNIGLSINNVTVGNVSSHDAHYQVRVTGTCGGIYTTGILVSFDHGVTWRLDSYSTPRE